MSRPVEVLGGAIGLVATAFIGWGVLRSYDLAEQERGTLTSQATDIHIGQVTVTGLERPKDGVGEVGQFVTDQPRAFKNLTGINNNQTMTPFDARLDQAEVQAAAFLAVGAVSGAALKHGVRRG